MFFGIEKKTHSGHKAILVALNGEFFSRSFFVLAILKHEKIEFTYTSGHSIDENLRKVDTKPRDIRSLLFH